MRSPLLMVHYFHNGTKVILPILCNICLKQDVTQMSHHLFISPLDHTVFLFRVCESLGIVHTAHREQLGYTVVREFGTTVVYDFQRSAKLSHVLE